MIGYIITKDTINDAISLYYDEGSRHPVHITCCNPLMFFSLMVFSESEAEWYLKKLKEQGDTGYQMKKVEVKEIE